MAKSSINQNYENMPKLGRAGAGGANRFQPVQKPGNPKGTFLRLLRLFGRWRKSILFVAFLTLLSTLASLFTPLLLGRAINTFSIEGNLVNTTLLEIILLELLTCYLAVWILDTINGLLMAKITQGLVKSIRTDFFKKLQRIPLQFFDSRSHGDTMSRITNDVDNISSAIAQATTQLISSLFFIIGALTMMLYLSSFLTIFALLAIPLFLLLTRTITKRSRAYFLGQQRRLGQLNGLIEENINGLKMVKAFNKQEKILGDFKTINGELCTYSTKAQTWAGFMMPFMNVINNLSFALIAGIGGAMTVRDMVSVGVVVSFLTYAKQFGQPLNNIAGMFNGILSALVGAERIFEILDEEEEIRDEPEAVTLQDIRGEIDFDKVSFSYSKGIPVLKEVSFHVNPGEVVALVRETGAGKTTIVNLMTRFYELTEGKISIDGHDIREIKRHSLRDCFSVVLQDTFLFTGTVSENIRYPRPEATEAEIRAASILAHADGFILRLPEGYDTIITGSADNLSQGQRQLIAIARAILCNAPILILDEATSSIDTMTEKEIQTAMLTLMKDKTSIIIAHRLSTIRNADRIFVIGEGEILESGAHEELMEKKGRYHEMVISQLGEELTTSIGL